MTEAAPLVPDAAFSLRSGVLDALDALLQRRAADVSFWFESAYAQLPSTVPVPIYSSVDVRHAGFKLAAVDTNLFPAGFNNLSESARARAADAFAGWVKQAYPQARRVLILPENHTRNLGYLDNVDTLRTILQHAGLEVQLGTLLTVDTDDQLLRLDTLSGGMLALSPVVRAADGLRTVAAPAGWVADLVLLNNDLTAGIPAILEHLVQPVVPAVEMGWFQRRKSQHFAHYARVVQRFAADFGLDPWLLAAEYAQAAGLDFKERVGLEALAAAVDDVLARVRAHYAHYGITSEPYVFIKADGGTYGMGIMTARSGAEVLDINKKSRNKMSVIKEGAEVSEVLIQEGVPTVDRVDDAVAEPVVYLVGGHAIGGAYRVNDARDAFGNLNATGMRFAGMCEPNERAKERDKVSVAPCHFNVFGLVAQLATLAAAEEHAALL